MTEKSENSYYAGWIVVFVFTTVLLPGSMHLSMINPVKDILQKFINDSNVYRYGTPLATETVIFQINLSQSLLLAGTAVGSIFGRYFIDNFSRNRVLVMLQVGQIVATILMSPVTFFAKAFSVMIIGRVIEGLLRGVALIIIPVIIAETVHWRSLVIYSGMMAVTLNAGVALGNLFGLPQLLGTDTLWPVFFALPVVGPVVFFCCLPWLPNTVTWLAVDEMKTGRATTVPEMDRPSYRLHKKLRRGSERLVAEEYTKKLEEIAKDFDYQAMSLCEIFATANYRRQIVSVLVVVFGVQATGAHFIAQYTNTILEGAGVEESQTTYYSIGLFSFMAMVNAASAFLARRFGSRFCYLCGQVTVQLGYVLLIVATETSAALPGMAYASVAALFIISVGLMAGTMLGFAVLPNELTTQITRPRVIWLSVTMFWAVAAVISFVTPYTVEAWGGYAYVPFILFVLLTMIYVKFHVPETQGKTVDEIQKFFLSTPKQSNVGITLKNPNTLGIHDKNPPSSLHKTAEDI